MNRTQSLVELHNVTHLLTVTLPRLSILIITMATKINNENHDATKTINGTNKNDVEKKLNENHDGLKGADNVSKDTDGAGNNDDDKDLVETVGAEDFVETVGTELAETAGAELVDTEADENLDYVIVDINHLIVIDILDGDYVMVGNEDLVDTNEDYVLV